MGFDGQEELADAFVAHTWTPRYALRSNRNNINYKIIAGKLLSFR
jgi:hypothetical protein